MSFESVISHLMSEEISHYSKGANSVLPEAKIRLDKRDQSEVLKSLESELPPPIMDVLIAQILCSSLYSMGFFEQKIEKVRDLVADNKAADFYEKWLKSSFHYLQQQNLINSELELVEELEDIDALWQQWEELKSGWQMNSNQRAQILLLETCLEALPKILQGEQLATEVMFPQSSMHLVEGIYKGSPVADYFNQVLGETLVECIKSHLKTDSSRKIRILEIGAGTGGTTAKILPMLQEFSDNIEEYCYTDLSKVFLMHAEKHYQPQLSTLTTKIFDVSNPLAAQSIEKQHYDFVIATNVLHATPNIRETLRNSKAALKSQGIILLNEISQWSLFSHLTFGLLEGWWLHEDTSLRITGSPGLSAEQWLSILTEEGFKCGFHPALEAHQFGQQIIAADSDGVVRQRAVEEKKSVIPKKTEIESQNSSAQTKQFNSSSELSAGVTNQSLSQHVKETLKFCIADAAKMKPESIEADRSFSDYGVDSIFAVQLIEQINEKLELTLQTSVIFDFSTLQEMTDFIVEEHSQPIRRSLEKTLPESVPLIASENSQVEQKNQLEDKVPNRFGSNNIQTGMVSSTEIKNQSSTDPIAIIGMSGRFAESESLEEFWQNIKLGKDLVREVTRWEKADCVTSKLNQQGFCSAGSFVDSIDLFDPEFFRITSEEATYMDPQQRLFLEESWKALEIAGYAGKSIDEKLCGVYVGCGSSNYTDFIEVDPPALAFWGNDSSIIPARIAYYLNLQGPAISVDTACSSSLVSIHLACQGLWSNETDMALAGGVFVQAASTFYQAANNAGMLSPQGKCHSFDSRADGFVPGEGVGVVVLKRQQEALDDGDYIHSLIIASGINQDGSSNGIVAPRAKSQERLEKAVYDRFDINPETIQVVEAHGTGTLLGDAIEYTALNRAFRYYTSEKQFCAIGSLKSNIGHAATAAGVAGVLKLVMALKNAQIPPSLHFESANPAIDFETSPFYLNSELRDWKVEKNQSRRAAISAFGFSGTNAHLILQEAPELELSKQVYPGYLITLSARTASQLKKQVANLVDFTSTESDILMNDLSYTLLVGRMDFKHRLSCVVRNQKEMLEILQQWLETNESNSQVYTSEIKEGDVREQISLKNFANQCLQECRTTNDSVLYLQHLSTIADLYIQGYNLEYQSLFASGTRRLLLPTYPFNKQSYWISHKKSIANTESVLAKLHPLLHTNTSDLSQQSYSSRFVGNESFMLGSKSQSHSKFYQLPSVIYLEMVRVAVDLAIPVGFVREQLQLVDIEWGNSAEISKHDLTTTALLGKNPAQMKFEIYASGDESTRVLCQGDAKLSNRDLPNQVDINSLKQTMIQQGLESIEKWVDKAGIEKHLVDHIGEIYSQESEVLAQLKLGDDFNSSIEEFKIHPRIMMLTFIATLGLSKEKKSDWNPLEPSRLELLTYASQCTKEMYALIRPAATDLNQSRMDDSSLKLDIDLFDSDGNLCILLRGLCFQKNSSTINNRNENDWQLSKSLSEGTQEFSMPAKDKMSLFLKQELAQQLDKEVNDISTEKNYFELGVSSLGVASLVQNTNNLLHENIAPSVIFEHENIQKFGSFLVKKYGSKIESLKIGRQKSDNSASSTEEKSEKNELVPLVRQFSICEKQKNLIATSKDKKKYVSSSESNTGKIESNLKEFPLSIGERGLYILQSVHPKMNGYNVPFCFKLENINFDALNKAWKSVLQQYPILTASIVEREGVLYHSLDNTNITKVFRHEVDFSSWDECLKHFKERVKEPFDLSKDPLTRIDLFDSSQRGSFLLITIHHIVFDGASAVVLFRNLFNNYQQYCIGAEVSAKTLSSGYQDFVSWEESMLASEDGRLHAKYWREQLSGDLPKLELVPNQKGISSVDFEATTLVEALPTELCSWLQDFSRSQNMQQSVIFLAVFQLLLNKYTEQEDIIIGMPVMGRASEKFINEVGYFINMVPLRMKVDKTTKFTQFVAKVQAVMMDSLYHSSYPLPLMLESLQANKVGTNSIFQISYAYQNFMPEIDAVASAQLKAIGIEKIDGIYQEGDFDLGLEVYEAKEGFQLHIKYNADLYTAQVIGNLFKHYCTLMQSISLQTTSTLENYSLLCNEERQLLVSNFNQTESRYRKEKCIHQLFTDLVTKMPDQNAIMFEQHSLTYQQLFDKSQSLALYLQSQGVGTDSLVGLYLERSIDMVVGIFGIMLAGGAYVPLDPEYPDDRLSYMLDNSQAILVLTQEKLKNRIANLTDELCNIVLLDSGWEKIVKIVKQIQSKGVELKELATPESLAYVIYTSGSTGKPKGVMIEHRALMNRIEWMQKTYQLEPQDIVLQKTPFSFDVSVWEFVWPIMAGASMVIAKPEGHKDVSYLTKLINQTQVTTLHFVPSMFSSYITNASDTCSSVRQIFCSGEALDRNLVEDYSVLFPFAQLHNLYGPTEAAIDVTAFDCANLETEQVPIGKPIANTRIYILDQSCNPLPVGIPGELHIAGDGLARGYLNRRELTDEKFIVDPFVSDCKMYKSGDLACWLPNGDIAYLGRIDTQVKIRGFRIETGEIESLLNQHEEIKISAVVVQGEGLDKKLVAFYTLVGESQKAGRLEKNTLTEYLLQSLPDYMIPVAFVCIDELPLTASGKVNRRALQQTQVSLGNSGEYVAPRNDLEKQMVVIWAQILKVEPEKIGINDSFFELGGHSLLATQLLSQLREKMDINLPLKVLFESSTIAQLIEKSNCISHNEFPPLEPVNREEYESLPLSFAQERIWLIDQLESEQAGYNLPGAVIIKGQLDVSKLEHAFAIIINRHDNLRTIFPSHDGVGRQVILDAQNFQLGSVDLTSIKTEKEKHVVAQDICQQEAQSTFDLEKGPLFRGKVLKISQQRHILILNMHHIISDGWSIGVLIKELSQIMQSLKLGEVVNLPPLPIQYVDYSIWQRQWLQQGEVLEKQLIYWQEKLSGMAESLNLTTDFPRSNEQNFSGASYSFKFPFELSEKLKQLTEQQGCTLYMTLLAAFKVLLYRYTEQQDICIGSPIANRQYGETEGLIGMFVNTLALRNLIEPEESFISVLANVRNTCLEAYEHQDAPFEKIVERVQPQRNMAISPLFQIMFILQNTPIENTDSNIQPYLFDIGTSKFDLSLELTETNGGLTGNINFKTSLFKPNTAQRMIRHFEVLCQSIVTAPEVKIRQLDYLEHSERKLLVETFNLTQEDYSSEECIHDLFIEQVKQHPNHVAVSFENESLSYQQLFEKSNDLALFLKTKGVQGDSLVGLCVERSLDMLIGILGIFQAGGAYVPFDPDYPDERLGYMLENSQPQLVLTQSKFRSKLSTLEITEIELIELDNQWSEIIAVAEATDKSVLLNSATSANLAYVIYTSGSTGKPKGVMVEHRALMNRIEWMQQTYFLTSEDIVLQKTPYSFDVSVWEFVWPLMSGASIVFAKPEGHKDVDYLEKLINQQQVTTLHFVPSMFNSYINNAQGNCVSVRQVFCSGEALERQLVDTYQEKFPQAKLHNLYGPTEAAIDVTAYDCSQLDQMLVPIGKPIANTQIYILDKYNQPQAIGVPGELHIAGDGLARGYLNRLDLTHEKFIESPIVSGTRLYKSGDLARWLEDGNIEYLGRVDTQVKIRGFRIETGEIEARLCEMSAIKNAAVVAQGAGINKQLIAFYEAIDTKSDQIIELDAEVLKAHLLAALPEYMLPAAFVSLAAIPLTSSGKANRRALENNQISIESQTKYQAPENDIEKQLVDLWANLLKRDPEKIGTWDNFFELGGHSLLASQLLSRIRSLFSIEMSLKALFEKPRIQQIAQLISEGSESKLPVILPVNREEMAQLPLSFAQERLWFIEQLEPGSSNYNIPGAVLIRGVLKLQDLEYAFNHIISRHDNLRTIFPSCEGKAQQQILQQLEFKLELIDVSHFKTAKTRLTKAKNICQQEATTAFDLATGPLLRGKVIKLAEQEHILILNMHHIISDGWSTNVLISELGVIIDALEKGHSIELPSLPVQYVDYSVWQREWLQQSGLLQKQLDYWQQKLHGVTETLNLMTDFPRPSKQCLEGAVHSFTISNQLTEGLKKLADSQGATLYMTLLAAFKVLLFRYTGQQDLCLGSPIANRQYAETEGLLGMFVNTLALRSQLDSGDSFGLVLEKVKATCLEAYENQDTPFEKVVERVQPNRNMAISPLFQVMLVLQNRQSVTDQRIQPFPLETNTSKFDLTLELTETEGGLAGAIEYSTSLYKPTTVERMSEHFSAICESIIESPAKPIIELEYMAQLELQQLLVNNNQTQLDYSAKPCIHELFNQQVKANPEQMAVCYGGETLSYQQLHDKSQTLALYLQSVGVGAETLVGLCMPRSLEMVVGMLAILQAGGAYVPLDPDYPEERLAFILQDCQAEILLTQKKLKPKLIQLTSDKVKLLALDQQWAKINNHVAKLAAKGVKLTQNVESSNLAYVIYTSGSTGQPKGVMIEHKSLHGLCVWHKEAFNVSKSSRATQVANIAFDAAVWEIWPYLLNSASLFLVNNQVSLDTEKLSHFINENKITHCFLVTPLAQQLFKSPTLKNTSLKYLLVGGDKLTEYEDQNFPFVVVNNYGPTESTVVATSLKIEGDLTASLIGAPIANTRIYILDSNGGPVPVGVPGELHIAGDGLARGYLYRDDLTAEKFVKTNLKEEQRLYKSGDLVRWSEDGNIEFLGRIDTQVKIRGFRIEIGEIESILNQLTEIKEAVVVAQGQESNKQLVAYYQADMSTPAKSIELSNESLKTSLRQSLPEHMIPVEFVSLEQIPLTPNGKVDRRTLEEKKVTLKSSHVYIAPGSSIEQQLVAIWSEILGIAPEKIGINDNFFEIGGHSLLAVQLVAKINAQTSQQLPLSILFSAPSIAALGKLLTTNDRIDDDILVTLQPDGEDRPVFVIPGAGGNLLTFQAMSQALGKRQPIYGLQAVGLDGKSKPLESVEKTAAANIIALKKVQKTGPYCLIGHSYGGVVAYEMALQLQQEDETVASLHLLDAIAPLLMQANCFAADDEISLLFEVATSLGNLYKVDLNLDIEQLQAMSGNQGIEHISDGLSRHGIEISLEQFNILYNVFKANYSCYRNYKPAALLDKLEVVLYRAIDQEQPNLPDDYGWNNLISGSIRIQQVNADHFTMLSDRYINDIASNMLRIINPE